MGGDAEVGRDHLSHRRGVERCGEDHVVVVVAPREDLVVGLAETGRELQSHQGHLQLVADRGGHDPPPPALHPWQGVVGHEGGSPRQCEVSLGRVVAVACAIDHPRQCVHARSGLEADRASGQGQGGESPVPVVLEVVEGREVAGVVRPVPCSREMSLVQQLVRPARAGGVVAGDVLHQSPLRARVFLGREIGLQQVGAAHGQHCGTRHMAFRLLCLLFCL